MHEESDALHDRVRGFIERAMAWVGRGALDEGLFEELEHLSCAVARFQAARVSVVGRLWQVHGLRDVDRMASIPAVPTDAFRLRRVAAHPEADDVRCFMTSGTTASSRGKHPMRTTGTYERAALAWGAHMLWPERAAVSGAHTPTYGRLPMVVLASPERLAPESSLTFMLARFAEVLGGDATWHFDGARVDVDGIIARLEGLGRSETPTLVAGTSFAFVHFLDELARRGRDALPLPEGSRVMQTGGFKGRSREIDAEALRALIAGAFAVPLERVVGEYGMTELSSQLYQGGLRGLPGDGYHPPPWVRVTAVAPDTLTALPPGTVGLARVVDLANVDGSVAIQTADRVRVEADGSVSLLGRAPGAPPRGCSLALEHLLEHEA